MTRKEAYAKAIKLVEHANADVKEAVLLIADARVVGGFFTQSAIHAVDTLLHEACAVTCDDCGLLVKNCCCAFIFKEVKRR